MPAWRAIGHGWHAIGPVGVPSYIPMGELFELVVYLLRKYWSSQQIARTHEGYVFLTTLSAKPLTKPSTARSM
ncbi:hypothetical protein DFO67_12915 [Modicisalibacter xianhensis]|uniref:Uncharacterized protein n=1 Tax=Modicisalibacter xianhensis TaxID=442341 RepID=A0A4R8FB50_9GAMM|nr:hypothetical protein DFO67_12915 [Halomonas xianhensis]